MNDEPISELFHAIVNQWGGISALGIEQLAIARQLARVLAADEGDPRAIIALAALLPQRAQVRFGLLTDAELEDLHRLMLKAAGEPVEAPAAEGAPSLVHNERRAVYRPVGCLAAFPGVPPIPTSTPSVAIPAIRNSLRYWRTRRLLDAKGGWYGKFDDGAFQTWPATWQPRSRH